jgi:hypothetical protein
MKNNVGIRVGKVVSFSLLVGALLLGNYAACFAAPVKTDEMFAIFCSTREVAFEGDLFPQMEILLSNEFKEQLDISDTQAEKLAEFITKNKPKYSDNILKKGFDLSMHKTMEHDGEKGRRQLVEILRRDQLNKMKDLMFRHFGLMSIATKELQQMFRLVPEQETKVEAIRSQMFQKINKTVKNPIPAKKTGVCRLAVIDTQKRRDIVRDAEQQIEKILSPEQKKRMAKMMEGPESR